MEADVVPLNVVVPDGCYPGDEIVVTHRNREQFFVIIPEGVGPGDMMYVDVPVEQPALKVEVNVPAGCFAGDSFNVDWDGHTFAVVVPDGCGPEDLLTVDVSDPPMNEEYKDTHNAEPPPPTATTPPAAAAEPPTVKAPELSDDSDSDDDAAGAAKFGVGAPVECMRTDGSWTLATVVEYDENGCTYTVALADGRLKYFVEEEDLRIPRFLLLSTGNI